MPYKTLDEIRPGAFVTVINIADDGNIKRRIMDIGILPGVCIEVVKLAPLGDPIQISLLGFDMVMRRSDASKIIVKSVDE